MVCSLNQKTGRGQLPYGQPIDATFSALFHDFGPVPLSALPIICAPSPSPGRRSGDRNVLLLTTRLRPARRRPILRLAVFEVAIDAPMAGDQFLAHLPGLFNDFLRISWPKRTCGMVSGETNSGGRRFRRWRTSASRRCDIGFRVEQHRDVRNHDAQSLRLHGDKRERGRRIESRGVIGVHCPSPELPSRNRPYPRDAPVWACESSRGFARGWH